MPRLCDFIVKLGVDVFFVLSGFLITSIILKGLDNNTFLFSAFYLRRAKRLLPALYSTLLFTTLLCLIALTNRQWLDYLEQLKGALTFTANIILPSQTGYFERASEGKPLLHIWSLSLEEQYYFLLPILLYVIPRNYRLIALSFFTVASLYWCLSWVYSEEQFAPFLWRVADSSKSQWAFYLLFTRAWELLAGSLCAWIMINRSTIELPKILKQIALALVLFICSVSINNEHPSLESFIVVLSTVAILLGSKDWLPNNFIVRSIERVGDWSYSIYLVHWPLFALAYLSYLGDVPTSTKIILTFLSITLGYLQFRYVEMPFRVGKFQNIFSNWKAAFLITFLLLAIPIVSAYTATNSEGEFSHIRRVNHGLGKECDGSFDENTILKKSCLLGEEPKIIVWGDSYAMHLVPGLSNKNDGLAQITKSVCGPIMGIAPMDGRHNSTWAKKCLNFNDNTLNYIKNNKSITHVVLSSTLVTYLNFDDGKYYTYEGSVNADYKLLVDSFKATILELIKLNITPVVVSPPPKSGFDIGECLERKYGGTLLLRNNCEISYFEYQQHQKIVNNTLKEIEKISNVIWLKDYLCENETCKVYIEDTFIYLDSGHLTIDGSIKLLKDIDIKGMYN